MVKWETMWEGPGSQDVGGSVSKNTLTSVRLHAFAKSYEDACEVYAPLLKSFPPLAYSKEPWRFTHEGKVFLVGIVPLEPDPSGAVPELSYSPALLAPIPFIDVPADVSPYNSLSSLYRNVPMMKSILTNALACASSPNHDLGITAPPPGAYDIEPIRSSVNRYVIVASSPKVLHDILNLLALYNAIASLNLTEAIPFRPSSDATGLDVATPPGPLLESPGGAKFPILFLSEPSKWVSSQDITKLNYASANPSLPDGMMLPWKLLESYSAQLLKPFKSPLASLEECRRHLSHQTNVIGMSVASDALASNFINKKAPIPGLSFVGPSVNFRSGKPGELVLVEDPRHRNSLRALLEGLAAIPATSPGFSIFGPETCWRNPNPSRFEHDNINLTGNLLKIHQLVQNALIPTESPVQLTEILTAPLGPPTSPPTMRFDESSDSYKNYEAYTEKRTANISAQATKISMPYRSSIGRNAREKPPGNQGSASTPSKSHQTSAPAAGNSSQTPDDHCSTTKRGRTPNTSTRNPAGSRKNDKGGETSSSTRLTSPPEVERNHSDTSLTEGDWIVAKSRLITTSPSSKAAVFATDGGSSTNPYAALDDDEAIDCDSPESPSGEPPSCQSSHPAPSPPAQCAASTPASVSPRPPSAPKRVPAAPSRAAT
jgi:hypothetical protein